MTDFYRNISVLVTGGAGFIGSHLTRELVQRGAQVTVLDDFSTGLAHNLAGLEDKISVINGSFTNPATCLKATKSKQIIFHLGAFISVPASVQDPRTCHDTNVNGTFNLLEAACINGVQGFVFSSSAAVYGPREELCCESMPCAPTSPYGTSKLIGELLCQQYSRNYGLRTVCLRYFNVFGERQNPDGAYAAVVAKFRHQMESNLPITIFGDGHQTRDFIPVADVVAANLLLGMQEAAVMNGQPFNIASGRQINLLELVELLKKDFPNYATQPTLKPARAGDIRHSGADIKKFKLIPSTP